MAVRTTLEGRLAAVFILGCAIVGALAVALHERLALPWLAVALTLLVTLPPLLYLMHWFLHPLAGNAQALGDGISRLRDGDYSAGLALRGMQEFTHVEGAFNELSHALREERQTLYQRELMLDTVIQSTPLAMLLCNASDRVLYSNAAARALFGSGRPLEGLSFQHVLEAAPESLREAMENGTDGLFTVEGEGTDAETYHLSRRRFTLNAQHHYLFLLKRLTQELSRQEVATWKKVIRVISHELNNSLAPMSSLAHSGRRIAGQLEHDKLTTIFDTIEDRAQHLGGFIAGYARFAKLPQPNPELVPWAPFVRQLGETIPFTLNGDVPEGSGWFDPAQLEQVLINLLKNAHESGSAPESVCLSIDSQPQVSHLQVLDRGTGLSDAVLASALLPFYSTKRSGTGLGLPLSREIIEAHGGRLALARRPGGGLSVSIWLPTARSDIAP